MVIFMKVKLYFENEKAISKSGIGKALQHQKKALSLNDIEFSTNSMCQDFDVLHINTTLFGSLKEIKKARKLNKAVVYHAHSTAEDFKNSFAFSNIIAPLYKRWLVKLYSKADVLVTPTIYSKSILESYGLKQPIYAISNGIDLDQFSYDSNKVRQFKEYFHLSKNTKVIISVGWLFERKGFDTFCEVATRFPDYTFIWFGDENLSMPTANIRHWIENKPENVILPGYISGNIIIGAYLSADLFFFPSREETEGIVVLEALASKTPILVRDIGVYDGWLENGVNCYKGNDTEDFVRLIQLFFDNKLQDTTNNGYLTANEKSFAEVGKQLCKAYRLAIQINDKKH